MQGRLVHLHIEHVAVLGHVVRDLPELDHDGPSLRRVALRRRLPRVSRATTEGWTPRPSG